MARLRVSITKHKTGKARISERDFALGKATQLPRRRMLSSAPEKARCRGSIAQPKARHATLFHCRSTPPGIAAGRGRRRPHLTPLRRDLKRHVLRSRPLVRRRVLEALLRAVRGHCRRPRGWAGRHLPRATKGDQPLLPPCSLAQCALRRDSISRGMANLRQHSVAMPRTLCSLAALRKHLLEHRIE